MTWTVTEVTKGLPTFARERRTRPRTAGRKAKGRLPFAVRENDAPWLRFESGGETRRLAFVPINWDSLTDVELEHLLGRSVSA